MSTEKMREEFESRVSDRAWFVPGGRVDASLPEGFEYGDFTTDMCWTCWVESRAAIEVELRDAYMKGWEMSGEGWNGEYPAMLHETERWQRERDEALGIKP